MVSQLTKAKRKEREFIIECIRLYKELPILWNANCKHYHNRSKKNQAYNILLCKYKQMYPEANKEDLKKKFNILRTNYRKELKKYCESGGDYQTSCWYFDELSFLQNVNMEYTEEDLSSIMENMDADERVILVCESEKDDSHPLMTEYNLNDESLSEEAASPKKYVSSKSRKLIVPEVPTKHLKIEIDPFQNWALACAADLKQMEPSQQIYAKKAIADILMEGQLGLLHRDSVQINKQEHVAEQKGFLNNIKTDDGLS